MAKKENEKMIKQDGHEWLPSFFKKMTEDEAIKLFEKTSYKRSTIIAVHKKANGKTKPNED